MTTQLAAFRLVIPEFATASDSDVQAHLDLAPMFIDPLKFSVDTRGLALAYMAASLLYTRLQSSNGESIGQNLTMEKEGELQRGYSAGKARAKDIYMQRLDDLSLQFAGSTIMTRFGDTVG